MRSPIPLTDIYSGIRDVLIEWLLWNIKCIHTYLVYFKMIRKMSLMLPKNIFVRVPFTIASIQIIKKKPCKQLLVVLYYIGTFRLCYFICVMLLSNGSITVNGPPRRTSSQMIENFLISPIWCQLPIPSHPYLKFFFLFFICTLLICRFDVQR